MWQIYAMMAKDQIDEQLHAAERRRIDRQAPRRSRAKSRLHVPAMLRHRGRPSSSTV